MPDTNDTTIEKPALDETETQDLVAGQLDVLKKHVKLEAGESDLKGQLAAIKPAVAEASGEEILDDPIGKLKQIVVDNYNEYRNKKIAPAMTTDLVVVLWYTGSRGNFKAICEFAIVHGVLYVVSYNVRKKEAYVDVYRKNNTVRLENV